MTVNNSNNHITKSVSQQMSFAMSNLVLQPGIPQEYTDTDGCSGLCDPGFALG